MRCALVALAAVLAAGCGDNIRGLPFDQLDAARRTAQCERLVRCGVFADQATCEGYFRPANDDALAAAIAAGTVSYDEISAKKCENALAEAGCQESARDVRVKPDDCGKIFHGKIAVGAECSLDEECATGDCSAPACPKDMCCTGTCVTKPAPVDIGGMCQSAAACGADAFCGTDQLCHVLGASGAACGSDSECDYGLGCIGAGIDPGTCRALPLLGESCPYLRCAEIGAACSGTETCVSSGPGAPCTSDGECSRFGVCDPTTQTCVSAPSIGMPCTTRCNQNAWCDRSQGPGICAAPEPNNIACITDDQCASSFCAEGPVFDFCASPAVCF